MLPFSKAKRTTLSLWIAFCAAFAYLNPFCCEFLPQWDEEPAALEEAVDDVEGFCVGKPRSIRTLPLALPTTFAVLLVLTPRPPATRVTAPFRALLVPTISPPLRPRLCSWLI